MKKNISIIGLGKLGACMAGVYASKGHTIFGIDINQTNVDAINNGNAPVDEAQLDEFIKNNHEKITASTSYSDAINKSEISFIIVPTPSQNDGKFSADYVIKACESIGKHLKQKNTYHLVVLTSTLLPGDCTKYIIPTLEKFSEKKCGTDFGFCYSPEFIAIGSVIHDLLNPDFFLIGQFDKKSGEILKNFYDSVSNNSAPSKIMSIASAELTKISVNSFLTMKITYANMLAEIAENIPGVDIDDVTQAIGSDERIGPKYLRAGLGYGGPCFPRDNRAFAKMAKENGVIAPFALHTDTYNVSIIQRAIKMIEKQIDAKKQIGILGLSYKPGTYFSEESQSLLIAKELKLKGFNVSVFDPNGYNHSKATLQKDVIYYKLLQNCINNVDVLFLGNHDKEYANLPYMIGSKQIIVIDPWRQYNSNDFEESVTYIPFGVCSV